MASPSFLNTGAKWGTDSDSDVQAAIDLFADLVLNQLDASEQWTDLGGGEYQTTEMEPAGAARKFSVQLTRASATVLQVLTKDQLGQTVFDGEIHLVGATEIKIFVGPWHYVIQFLYGASVYELALGGMADPRPLPLSSHHMYVAAKTTRVPGGAAASGSTTIDYWVMRDSQIVNGHIGRMTMMYTPGLGSSDGRTSGGSNFHLHCDMIVQPTSLGVYGSAGKLIQFILVSQVHPPGTIVDVPISDDGGVGQFEVLGLENNVSGFSGRLAVRRSAP